MTRVLGLRDLDLCFALTFKVPDRILVGFHHGVGGLTLGKIREIKHWGVCLGREFKVM